MEKQNKHFSKLTILFYVFAILTFIYCIFSIYKSYEYVNALVKAGQLTISGNIGDVIQYFVDNSSAYLFYGLGFGAFGYLIQLLKNKEETDLLTSSVDFTSIEAEENDALEDDDFEEEEEADLTVEVTAKETDE
ncbi:hypothetical protein [Beduini massiliensis]|uniref:hypothetical protein n=1 Tax=Beduini massiliensis TaxID=1585974 RepID=UPI00059A7D31|nr:hypothetical protein [Beduini massiliensis]